MKEPLLEQQITEDFKNYEGITIERLEGGRYKATFQEQSGEGSVTGDSVSNVLLQAVRRQKTQRFWNGYKEAQEKAHQEALGRLELLQNQVNELTTITYQLKALEIAMQLLADNIVNLRTELLAIKAEIMKEERPQ